MKLLVVAVAQALVMMPPSKKMTRVCARGRTPFEDFLMSEPALFEDYLIQKRRPNFNWLYPVASLAFVVAYPGFVFKLVALGLALVFVGPPLASYGLQLWARANTAECPRCGSTVESPKIGETMCMQCGTSLVATTNRKQWRVRSVYDDEPASVRGAKRATQGVIDVDHTVED